ncbi:hypothetical protein GGS26DRAFT_543122 [Hypomontagnella submonticulosa]|nr:hypothetical protein GGS26DRAFT_543122 [Hypomontagnella submonticulosa]
MDSDDGESGSGNIFETYPFSWVLVPIIIFVGVGTLLLCYRYRRRRKLRMQYGTNALARDLEAMGNQPRPRMTSDRRARRDGLGAGFGSREEGLNELGEAPPAYTAPQKRSDDTEDIELSPIQQPPGATTAVGAGVGRLPAYDELQERADRPESTAPPSTSNPPELPPRAVLSPT